LHTFLKNLNLKSIRNFGQRKQEMPVTSFLQR